MGWRTRVLRLGLGLGFEGWEERKKKVRRRRERAKRRRRGFGVRRFVGWCFFQAFAIGESEGGESGGVCFLGKFFMGFPGKWKIGSLIFRRTQKRRRKIGSSFWSIEQVCRDKLQCIFLGECFSSGSGDVGECANVHLVLRLGS